MDNRNSGLHADGVRSSGQTKRKTLWTAYGMLAVPYAVTIAALLGQDSLLTGMMVGLASGAGLIAIGALLGVIACWLIRFYWVKAPASIVLTPICSMFVVIAYYLFLGWRFL